MNNISFEHLYTVGGYITFKTTVVSGDFAGSSSFCISQENLKDFIQKLSKANEELSGSIKITDCDSNDDITVEYLKYGHVQISGQVGGSYNEQYLVYSFEADQTTVARIIGDFKNMIE